MSMDPDGREEDLSAAVERARRDREFVDRPERLVERDAEILDRLAGIDHRERVDEAARRVQAVHDEALRRLGDD